MLDNDNPRLRDIGLLVLRVVVGCVFIGHGYLHGFKMGPIGVAGFFGHVGVPVPGIIAWFVIIVELIGGPALILGILTLPFALALAIDVAGAIYFTKLGGGLIGPKGFELELTLLAASLAIALTGPGAISLSDAIRGRDRPVV